MSSIDLRIRQELEEEIETFFSYWLGKEVTEPIILQMEQALQEAANHLEEPPQISVRLNPQTMTINVEFMEQPQIGHINLNWTKNEP